MLRIRDGIRCLFNPLDPGWVKTPKSGSGKNIPDHISESLETIFCIKILKFFDADADPGIFLTLDPGWKNSDPGSGKHPESVTLETGKKV